MDAKLEFEVDVEGSAYMMIEKRGMVGDAGDGWMIRRGTHQCRRPTLRPT